MLCGFRLSHPRNSSRTHHVCRFADGRGCTCPAGCLLAAAETCQTDGFPETPRSRTHNRQRRYPQRRSAWDDRGVTKCVHLTPTIFPLRLFSPRLTGLSLQSSLRTSGAIQPSVPGTPDLLLKLWRPTASFLHKPKSEIMARTRPWALGMDTRMLWGFRSRWTEEGKREAVSYFSGVDVVWECRTGLK